MTYKILMAPVNISGQPKMLVDGLKELGVDARLFQYGKHKFGYESDMVVDIGTRDRSDVHLDSLRDMLDMDFDIYHFWFRTFYFGSYYDGFPGFDLPVIKAAGKKILYRFTGYDLRMSSLEMEINPWHAYQYGFQPLCDEVEQKKYLNYLSGFADQFIVQDIEMESYMLAAGLPKPKIIPRSLDLKQWPFLGVRETERPLVIHAPSNSIVKGTPFILEAVEQLLDEGLDFEFKVVQGMTHDEAKGWYERCDLAIDQLLIGWYGVFSMECMALGKPTIVYIRDDLVEKSSVELPILNANPSNIKSVLKEAILDFDLRQEYSIKQRKYVEDVHDVNKVAKLMKDCYDEIIDAPFSPANSSEVVPHMKHQMRKLTEKSNRSFFIDQRSGVSVNQDHFIFKALKKVKRAQTRVGARINKKKEIIASLVKKPRKP